MRKRKKYIVYESYMFGENYYNEQLQCIPNYQVFAENEIPVVSERVMKILIGRNPGLCVKIAK